MMSLAKKIIIAILSWFFVLLLTFFILFHAASLTILNPDFISKTLENNQTYDKIYDVLSSNASASSIIGSKAVFRDNLNMLLKNVLEAITNPGTDYSMYEKYFGNNVSEFKQLIPALKELSFLYVNRIILLIVCALLLIILILLENNVVDRIKAAAKLFFKSSITLFLYAAIMFVLVAQIFPQILPKNNVLIEILLPALSEILNSFANQLLFYGIICLLFALLLYFVNYLLAKKENQINKQLVSN